MTTLHTDMPAFLHAGSFHPYSMLTQGNSTPSLCVRRLCVASILSVNLKKNEVM